ncbi:MAG: hypothetical protein ACW990_00085 [Promethearchaeota archaeon]|jgi:hypothetical protein
MRAIEKVWLWKYYFIRGHAQYLALVISIFNFIVIQFELLWKKVLESNGYFISIIDFTVIFGLIYFPFAIYLGRFDFKNPRGGFKVESNLVKQESPIYKDVFKNQKEILENQEVLNNKLDEINKKIANVFLEVDEIEDIAVNEPDMN